MAKFNPEGKSLLTLGETLGPAMSITCAKDAEQYLLDYAAFLRSRMETRGEDGATAMQVAKSNIGYYAGYYDNETRKRVERLFLCEHPIFGSASNVVTPEQASVLGEISCSLRGEGK